VAVRAVEHIDVERPPEKLSPRAVAACVFGHRVCIVGCGRSRRRLAQGRDARARERDRLAGASTPATSRYERAGAAASGGQTAQQRQWVHLDRDRAVSARTLEGDAYQVTGNGLQPLLRDGRSQHGA
jgi:hypothetical protein